MLVMVIAHLADCLESHHDALIDFKISIKGLENRLSSWHGSNCCQWRGIACDNTTGSVIRIDLHNPYPLSSNTPRYAFWNLSGEIRPSLQKLKSLTHLDLSFNTLQGIPIPGFLGSLKNLQYLNLTTVGFRGSIPPNLGNLSSLQYLNVSSQPLTVYNLQWMTSLASLKHLDMNQVDLSLVGSNWIEFLNKLPFLTDLHLSNCGLFGSISSLGSLNFTSLALIDISLNSFDLKFPDWIANGKLGKNIEVLGFSDNKLHGKLPASIGNMKFLTDFDLSSNGVEGGIPSSIGRLCSLINFDLSSNNLTKSLPELLEGTENCVSGSPLPSLVSLRVSNNRLVGELPDWLGQLENLSELGLNYKLFEGSIPYSLGTLRNLTSVGLGGNKLNGTLLESFGQLPELTFFDVSSNQLQEYL
ncbi:hypothetical protein F0562_001882 [Nyssa sinensis]|uniref:Leucine-rich repeat-containing N-terminal plant-type domain-containing protein n=1 Tax=Nyssa sinensis TaxID=561372 RepID=A0A5J5C4H9_9ASTE|nr:hypothetical protein F0562_001882 [Nyssa sinensis]